MIGTSGRVAGAVLCGILWAASASAEPDGSSPSAAPVDPIVEEVEELVRNAHFHTALGVARAADSWDDEAPPTRALRAQRVRLQVLVATAHVALGADERAKESLRRALTLDPALSLDAETTSPKVLQVLHELRPARPVAGR